MEVLLYEKGGNRWILLPESCMKIKKGMFENNNIDNSCDFENRYEFPSR
jgi:hypothetical protein